MNIHFYKYQGAGNDFVILDNRSGTYSGLTSEQIHFLCDRRFGIGADGLMLLNTRPPYDFEMKYYNADGREGSMCGNGGRCLVKFASDQGITQSIYRFLAIDGEHEASLNLQGTVSLKMNDVTAVHQNGNDFVLNTGSPHFVRLTNGVMQLDVRQAGKAIRYAPQYQPQGINVNFVEQLETPDQILVRTYERGVEDETLSCGTGVTAAALMCFHNENGFNHIDVHTKGGRLSVEFEKAGHAYTNIWLSGPAQMVFDGTIELPAAELR